MAKNNGHWYTDKNGNHYFVENGQSPKEGWEASKRRKMISGGKYMTSEDGNDYSEVDKDKYDAYEADEADFDENVDDDFGFDEEEDNYTSTIDEMRQDGVNVDDPREVMQYLGANMGLDREDQVSFMERLGYSVNDIEKLRNPGDDYEEEFKEYDLSKDIVANKLHEEYEDLSRVPENELVDFVKNEFGISNTADARRIVKGALADEDAYDKAMEEVLDEVANGEYNREMKKAQEQNAMMSEGQNNDFNRGQTVDAPEKGQGWKKTKMASGTLYEGPNGERYMDDGSAPEKVKIGAKEMTKDEWKEWYHKLDDNNREMGKEFLLNHASEFDMSERDMERFLTDGSQNYIDSPEFKKIQEFGKRLKYNDADSRDGYLTQDEYNDVVGFAAKYNLSEEKLKEMGFGDYSGGIVDEINNSKRNRQQPQPTGTQGNLPRYAIERFKSGDYDSNTAMEEILKAFPNALSALNWMLSEFKRK